MERWSLYWNRALGTGCCVHFSVWASPVHGLMGVFLPDITTWFPTVISGISPLIILASKAFVSQHFFHWISSLSFVSGYHWIFFLIIILWPCYSWSSFVCCLFGADFVAGREWPHWREILTSGKSDWPHCWEGPYRCEMWTFTGEGRLTTL